jgi:hypothetical protein
MGARSYVPTIGRFLQSEPGGSANTYAYTSAGIGFVERVAVWIWSSRDRGNHYRSNGGACGEVSWVEL